MKNTQKHFLFIFIIFLSLFALRTHSASAASVSFNTPASVNVGDNLDVTVNTDTGGVLINSAEVVVDFDQNLLSFSGYSDDNSMIKLWINPPHATLGQISFSGIIPGGVSGVYDAKKTGLSPIPLVHLLFTAKNSGTLNLSIVDSKILEHDGLGTPLLHDNVGSSVIITNNPNPNITQNDQNNVSINKINNNVQVMPDISDPLFWIVILLVISGYLIYKLVKYKV